MANSLKGEVGFEAGGVQHTICFDYNNLVRLEDALEGADVAEVAQAARGKVRTLRTVFWAGLRPVDGVEVSEQQAGDLISEIGPDRAGDLINQAFELSQVKGAAKAPARPPRAKGTAGR